MDRLAELQNDVTRRAFSTLNSVVRPPVEAGFANPSIVGGGAVVLEVIGRSSGLPRQVPLLASRVGDTLVVSTVRDDSQWLKNVEANPNVTVHLYGARRPATAAVRRGPLNVVTLKLVDED